MFIFSLAVGFCILAMVHNLQSKVDLSNDALIYVTQKQMAGINGRPKSRRYDINELGYENYFHGWADVQGQGGPNDYCRIVGRGSSLKLSCALAGTHGESDQNYVSGNSFEVGYNDTWYMKDEDGDGRDDYCRCLGSDSTGYQIVCTKAGPIGFYGSSRQGGRTNSFTPTGTISCKERRVRSEFGKVYAAVL